MGNNPVAARKNTLFYFYFFRLCLNNETIQCDLQLLVNVTELWAVVLCVSALLTVLEVRFIASVYDMYLEQLVRRYIDSLRQAGAV